MKFPDGPIATAGIGVACALVLLLVLSWPSLFSSMNAANYVTQPSVASNSGTTVYETSLSTSKITSAVSSVTVVGTAIASMSTVVASSTNGNSSGGTIVGAGDTMTSISSEATASTVTSRTVMSSSNLQSSPAAQPLFAFNYGSASGTASGSTNLSGLLMLAIISIVSLVIAVSSMLFLKRRANSEKVVESQTQ